MSSQSAKENILRRIRQALSNPVPLPFPESEGNQSLYKTSGEDLAVLFAENFSFLQGKFAVCHDETDMIIQLKQLMLEKGWKNIYCRENRMQQFLHEAGLVPFDSLADCDASLTGCEFLVSRTGTIVMSSAQQSGRTTSVYAPIHICIAYNYQLVFDVKDALQGLQHQYKNNLPSLITFASGPSRTADIEKTLVTGVHGPKEVYCFLVDG